MQESNVYVYVNVFIHCIVVSFTEFDMKWDETMYEKGIVHVQMWHHSNVKQPWTGKRLNYQRAEQFWVLSFFLKEENYNASPNSIQFVYIMLTEV